MAKWILNLSFLLGFSLLSSSIYASTWVDISPAGYSTDIFREVHFFDNSTGVVVGDGGIILKTTDGGANWSPIASGTAEDLLGLSFYDSLNGIAVGRNGTAIITSDGGDSWSDASSGLPVQDLSAVSYVNSTEAYASSADTNVYKFNGTSWSSQATDANLRNGIAFAASNIGITVGPNNSIYYTSNGGVNWNAASGASGLFYAVDFPTTTVAYAVGSGRTVNKTIDGGATWTNVSPSIGSSFYAVDFVDANTGYATGTSGFLMKTTDGGVTWEDDISTNTNLLHGIHFPVDINVGYAVGVSGTILKTSDGSGNNFYMHPTADASTQFTASGCVNSFDCINDQTGNASTGIPEANSNAEFVTSSAASFDLYDLADNTIPAGSIISGFTITAQLGRSNGATPTMYLLYQREGIDPSPQQGPAITSIGTTCCTTTAEFTVTGLNWSRTELNALRIGFEHDGTSTVYVSQLYVQVAYTAGSGATSTISGQVFNDANFNGTATAFGAGDTKLGGIDVELYQVGGSDVYIASAATDGSGNYSFSNVEDGTYKVRVRSASIGGSNPAPEMTWANGVAAYGGQDPNVDDTATGDNAGPGDTYTTIVVNSSNVSGVDFGFAYNLIVNTKTSGQGSLGQFIDIANTSALLGANNKSTQFRIETAANRSDGGDSWHGIAFSQANVGFSQITSIADGITIDGSTQTTNVGNSNSRGPEIEIYCTDCTGSGSPAYGLDINADAVSISNLTISGFNTAGIRLMGGINKIYSNYIGTNGVGTAAASPSNTTGVLLENFAANYSEIGNYVVSGDTVTSGLGNVISGNGVGIVNRNSSWIKIRGNLIGTDAAGTGLIGNSTYGIELRVDQASAQGVIVGGNNSDKANVIAGGTDGIVISNNLIGADIQGNYIGTDTTGAQDFGGTGSGILANSTNGTPIFKIGGLQAGEGNTIANYGGVGINYIMSNAGTHEIQGNSIKTTGGNGIVVSTAGVRIEKNIVYDLTGSAQGGISVSGPGAAIYHNTIHNVAGDGIDVQSGATNSVVRNNIVSSATGADVVNGEGLADTRITYNNFYNNGSTICSVSCDSSNTANDPFFLLPAGGNFNLSCGSLLIDAGLDIDTLGNGEVQTDLNGATAGKYSGTAPDMGALDGSCGTTYSVSGTVFNDANFAGTASAYDGGTNDVAISGADVEIYSNSDVYLDSQTTAGDGSFSFAGIADGTYKLRVRSATINGTNVPELAWANGAALYGGQDTSVDDTTIGDNAGPGDTYATVVVSGGNLTGIEFGFAYNLITNVNDSGQGSLRQFMVNANAGVLGASNNTSQFRIGVPTNQSSGGDSWWRITPVSELPQLTVNATGVVLDATTQETYIGGTGNNSLGPDVEIYGASCGSCDGIYLFNATDVTIKGFVINSFSLRGINIGGSAPNTTVQGNYIGTDATGTSDLGNTSYGVLVTGGSAIIGGTGAGEGNVISGNDDWQIYLNSASGYFIQGNKIGTNATGDGIIHTNPADQKTGIYGFGSNGTIGGSTAGAGNIFGGNDNAIGTTGAITSLVIQGNTFGTDSSGTLDLGNKQDLSIVSSATSSNIKIGGVNSGEGNLFANANTGTRAAVTVDLSNTAGVNEISGNIIRDTEDTGIRVLNGQTLEITKNIIIRAGQTLGDKGIVLSAGDGTRVYHNTLDSNYSGAIDASNTTNVIIRNNIISNHSDGGDIGINDANNNISILSNNLYFNNDTDCSGAICASESGKVTASPQFVDASTDDYRLLCGSPAIDAAVNLAPLQSWTMLDSGYDIGAEEQSCVSGVDISGRVFLDNDFTGTASSYDGGVGDATRAGIDVELYDNSNVYLNSTTTAADGTYTFAGLANGTYKVRIRSATVDAGSSLPELAWANGAALYGGQNAAVDDTATGDNAGIGDTYVSVTVSGSNVANVDFGFAYNLIVNVNNTGQGSLDQVFSNANVGSLSATKGNLRTEFRIDSSKVATNQTDGSGNNWWRIAVGTALQSLTTNASNLVIDSSRQETNTSSNTNTLGPDIEINGNGCSCAGITLDTATGVTIQNLGITQFTNGIQLNASATATNIYGNYIGISADGTSGLGNSSYGVNIIANSATIGGNTSALRNIISGNTAAGIYANSTGITGLTIQGNYIGTQADGSGSVPNDEGIHVNQTSSGATTIVIGGLGAGEGNLIVDSASDSSFGIYAFFGSSNNEISGNTIRGGNGGGIFISSGSGITIQKNIIANVGNAASDYGIYLATTTGVNVFHNTIYQSSGYGISTFITVSNAIVQNNIFSNNGDYAIYDADQKITTVSNNLYFQNNGGSGDCYYDGTNCDMAQTIDTNSTIADPQFVNAASSDFSLTECSSPSINTGLDLGASQPDINGAAAGNYNGNAPDMGAVESSCASGSSIISGTIFNDADFTGTASAYDGGTNDVAVSGVDVELYNNSDVYQLSTTTAGDGSYSFTGLADGTYKVRVRSATVSGGSSIPELAWANGSALYGGQDAAVDDTATGDNAGIGDTYVTVVISGGNISNVDFGFAYNLIVNTEDSGQGTLRQFMLNANNGILSGTALTSQFRMQVSTNQSSGAANWWRISPSTELPTLLSLANNVVLDASTQRNNSGSDDNASGPEIEINGASCASCDGFVFSSATGVTIHEFALNGFVNGIDLGASAANAVITGNYIGVDAAGTAGVGNSNHGINVQADNAVIGGNTANLRNVISANSQSGIQSSNTSAIANITIQGNYIGTNATGTAGLGNGIRGITLQSANASSTVLIGGTGDGEGNLIGYSTNTSSAGIFIDVDGGVHEISGNTIRYGNGMGLYIFGATNLDVHKNIIHDIGDGDDNGIYVWQGTNINFINNTIYNVNVDAINISGGSSFTVRNNIFSNNGNYAIFDAAGAVTTIGNNNYYANASICSGVNCGSDANSITTDPLFVNVAGGDFSLTECTSGAINTGVDLGASQPDMNGATAGNFNGSAPDMGAVESSCASGSSISGTVFEDADYAGTPANWDSGISDLGLANVTVELYNSGNSLADSTTTAGDGSYSFTGLADDTYKVRVVSSTIGDADTTPRGGYNACVPATCSYPVPEMTWAYNAAKLGGADKNASDVGAAAPGDTFASVTVSSTEVTNVNLGFAYNAIVNTNDSDQGSFRQFLLNANAIGAANGTTANTTEFDTSVFTTVTTVQIIPATAYPDITDDGTVIDASDNRIILWGASVPAGVNGLTIQSSNNVVKGISIQYFKGDGIEITSGTGNILGGNNTVGAGPYKEHLIILFNGDGVANGGDATDDGIEINSDGNFVYSSYIGTDGGVDAGNIGNGIYIAGDSNTIGGATAETWNLISGNDQSGIYLDGASFNTIQGNIIGTNSATDAAIANSNKGIWIANASTFNTVGGDTALEANVISGNNSTGVYITEAGSDNNVVSGNYIGTNSSGATNIGNNGTGVYISVSAGHTTIGGGTAAEGNTIAGNISGIGFNTDSVDTHIIWNNYIGTNAASDNISNTNYGIHCNQVNGVIALLDNVIGNSGISGLNGACNISLTNTNYVNDDITLSTATLNMNNGTLNLSGNMNNTTTTITAGTSSNLVLDGTDPGGQSMTFGTGTTNFLNMEVTNASAGGVTFNDEFTTTNFTAETPSSILTFTSGVTYTFIGTLILNGQDNTTRIQLNATGASPYTFDIQSETQYAYFVDVDYSHTETSNIIAYESTDPSSTTDAALAAPHWVFENAIVVNTSTDDGNPDSLRQAFINAVSGQNIVFNPNKFPPDGPVTISINSSLAANTDNLIITGENAGVIIDGGGVVATCLTIDSSNVTIRGLRIQNCTENGILINSGTNNTIGGNNTSGKGPSGEGNTLVLNGSGGIGNGLRINSNSNFVYGNYIGIAPSSYPGYSAAEDLGNVVNGILIAATATGNVVGDTATGRVNVLSANNVNGITITGNTNTLVANYIGTNESATATMGNSTTGVLLSGAATGNNIGGTGNNEGNIIAGNLGDGIVHDSTGSNNVYGNTISQTAIPNADDGVDARSGTVVLGVNGGSQPNVITGNTGFGVHVNGGTVNFDTSVDINDDVRLTSGAVDMGNATVNLSGNWIHVSGTVAEGTSTLVLDSTAIPQDVGTGTGNNFYNVEVTNSPYLIRFFDGFSCNNFSAVTPASTLQFQANETYTINGTLNINGQAAGTEISLSSSSGVDQFTFNTPNSEQSVSYVNVTRSNADGHDIYAYFSNSIAGNDEGDPSPHWIFNNALSITKRAFLTDGTPLTNGVSVPKGTLVKYMLYVNNFQAAAKTNVSVVDVLDPAFAYQSGTIKIDNSVDSCATPICSAAEEAAIFAVVDANTAGTDLVDVDRVSYTGGTTAVEAGNRNAANAQLDIASNKVWVILFTVKIQ